MYGARSPRAQFVITYDADETQPSFGLYQASYKTNPRMAAEFLGVAFKSMLEAENACKAKDKQLRGLQ